MPDTIDAYLAQLSAEQRAALDQLRKIIASAAPRAQECISYGMPAFTLDGRRLLTFGATAKHCALYAGALPVRTFKAELADYSTSIGTIRFTPEHPLPAPLVRKLVKLRIDQYAAKRTDESAR
jgi:uncharacterized protein YdhG (YjbR/CyaY superfamily)